MLKIKLLGKAKIEYEGQDITEKFGLKTLALLSLLLMEKKPVSREKLIVYLWPDSSEEAGKYNLRFNLWIIKSVIENDAQGNAFLCFERGFCGINPKYDLECDILNIKDESAYEKLSIERLEKLVSEFSGDFMEGFYFKNCNEYNEIILMERNIFENIRIKLFLALTERYGQAKRYDDSMKILSELAKVQPYDEEIALMIMDMYELQNKPSAAILFYNEFKNRIITCLGVEPAEELKAKYEYLKSGDRGEKYREAVGFRDVGGGETKKEPGCVDISTFCIRGIKYFWIGSFVNEIMKLDLSEALKELDLRDIAEISSDVAAQYAKGQDSFERKQPYNTEIFDVRLANAFIRLVRKLAEHYKLSVYVKKREAMDEFSEGIYEYIVEEKLIESKNVAY